MNDHWTNILNQFPPETQLPVADSETCYFSALYSDLLVASGTDSQKFLQGQATCNLDDLEANTWMPGAICDPKGRMITSFSLYPRDPGHLILEMQSGLASVTQDAIQKYSAFFKTELSDDSATWHVTGIAGKDAAEIISKATGLNLAPETTLLSTDEALLIKVSDSRYKLLTKAENTQQLWASLSGLAKPVISQYWELLDIYDGIGNVQRETSSEFIPQMINLQARGGISFRKGCYTGQEIVARMKYLGKLKRRMYHLQVATNKQPAPGTPCFIEPQASQQGHVVSALLVSDNQLEMLAVLTEELASSNRIYFPDSDVFTFEIKPLPYSLDG